MYLEGEVVAKIAQGAELLVLPKADGGLEDLSAFHALMLLIRTGRRIKRGPLDGLRPAADRW